MFWERFYELCVENGTKPNPIAAELGFSSGGVTKWKNGVIPNSAALEKIAAYFDVSTDYLLGKTSIRKNVLSEREQKMLNIFNALSVEQQDALFVILDSANNKGHYFE